MRSSAVLLLSMSMLLAACGTSAVDSGASSSGSSDDTMAVPPGTSLQMAECLTLTKRVQTNMLSCINDGMAAAGLPHVEGKDFADFNPLDVCKQSTPCMTAVADIVEKCTTDLYTADVQTKLSDCDRQIIGQ